MLWDTLLGNQLETWVQPTSVRLLSYLPFPPELNQNTQSLEKINTSGAWEQKGRLILVYDPCLVCDLEHKMCPARFFKDMAAMKGCHASTFLMALYESLCNSLKKNIHRGHKNLLQQLKPSWCPLNTCIWRRVFDNYLHEIWKVHKLFIDKQWGWLGTEINPKVSSDGKVKATSFLRLQIPKLFFSFLPEELMISWKSNKKLPVLSLNIP